MIKLETRRFVNFFALCCPRNRISPTPTGTTAEGQADARWGLVPSIRRKRSWESLWGTGPIRKEYEREVSDACWAASS